MRSDTANHLAPLRDVETAAFLTLQARFGTRLTRAESVREQHSGLEGHHPLLPPEAVVFAETAEEVAWLVNWCRNHSVPIIPHGAGTSLEGHLSAIAGGISLDLTRMNRILDVAPENLLCTVEAGVTREDLNRYLRDSGLFFPVDPGANATLGGMAATRASGTNAIRYGTMRDNILSAKVVLADGGIIETGTRAAKSAAGYDLTALFVGQEGTLGIITELTLRLYGIPETMVAATCHFDRLADAVNTVIQVIQMGIAVARIELLDAHQIAACNAYSGMSLPERPTLFLEFHGSQPTTAEEAALFGAIAEENRAQGVKMGFDADARSQMWKARHNAYFAAKALLPNARVWTTDVCVPIAALAESISTTREEIDASGVIATIVGHVGDGNYHVMFVLDPEDEEAWGKVAAINEHMITRAIALGGTCTGEHGIGIGKRDKLIEERGPSAVALMAKVKKALDPANILNPGKVI